MQQFNGKGIAGGMAAGQILFYKRETGNADRISIEDTAAELDIYNKAKVIAKKQLRSLYENASKEIGEDNARIFEAHRLLLDEFDSIVTDMVRTEKVCAEYAVEKTADIFIRMLSGKEDDFFDSHISDIKDIADRLVRILSRSTDDLKLTGPVILASVDLSPSELIQCDSTNLLGVVMDHGSANSHTAILARSMGIPVVSGLKVDPEWNGKQAVVNGYEGTLIVNPDQITTETLRTAHNDKREHDDLLNRAKEITAINSKGKVILVPANIGTLNDVDAALENGADGVGLFRSEFLYLAGDGFPSEETQFNAYKTVAQKMTGKRVVIRTLDLGSDKNVSYWDLGREGNPAMGYRGIRISLDRPDIFKTQLKAILRASAFGDLAIMFPMITTPEEVLQSKKYLTEAKEELKAKGIPYNEDIPVGIMIETPAAAMISDILAKESDFFSIGTNDLMQFTFAADRCNSRLDSINDPKHPAFMELIRKTIENGHREGIRVAICGELAADTSLTKTFVDLDVDELSVAPRSVPAVKAAVSENRDSGVI